MDGSLFDRLLDKLPLDMLDLVVREAQRRSRVESAEERKIERAQVARANAQRPVFYASSFFIPPALAERFAPLVEQFLAVANRTFDRERAGICLAENPMKLGKHDQWAAALTGAAAVSFEY